MKILVTGASGVIGGKLLEKLVQKEDSEIIVLARNPDGFKPQSSNVSILKGDLTATNLGLDKTGINRLKEVDVAYHLAANTSLYPNSKRPFKINVEGTRKLLEVLEDSELSCFNYFSSAYSCGLYESTVPEDWLSRPEEFRNAYEQSKFISEGIIREHNLRKGLHFNIFRPSIIFSSSGKTKQSFYKYAKIISEASKHHDLDRPIKLYGVAKRKINIIPLNGLIDIVLGLSASRDKIYNLTDESGVQIQEIVNAIAEVYDIRQGFEFVPDLKTDNLTLGEKVAYQKTKPFWGYTTSKVELNWAIDNSAHVRNKFGIIPLTINDIKMSLMEDRLD